MKFQNPSLNFFLNARKDERTSRNQYAPHVFKVGGIKSGNTVFFHYNPMGAICCHGNQSSDPIWPKT